MCSAGCGTHRRAPWAWRGVEIGGDAGASLVGGERLVRVRVGLDRPGLVVTGGRASV